MTEVNGKYIGEGSNGPVRVRVEDAHPRDPDFIGDVSPDHYVPHVHIEHRVNGKTGPWGLGGNKISFPQEWLK